MPKHWMPPGWYVNVRSNPPGPATWSVCSDDVPMIEGQSANAKQAERDAIGALMRATWGRMDEGWTRGRHGNGSVVHLRIQGHQDSLCGVRHLDDGPNTACAYSSPYGTCTQIERGTFARYVPELAEMYGPQRKEGKRDRVN